MSQPAYQYDDSYVVKVEYADMVEANVLRLRLCSDGPALCESCMLCGYGKRYMAEVKKGTFPPPQSTPIKIRSGEAVRAQLKPFKDWGATRHEAAVQNATAAYLAIAEGVPEREVLERHRFKNHHTMMGAFLRLVPDDLKRDKPLHRKGER